MIYAMLWQWLGISIGIGVGMPWYGMMLGGVCDVV